MLKGFKQSYNSFKPTIKLIVTNKSWETITTIKIITKTNHHRTLKLLKQPYKWNSKRVEWSKHQYWMKFHDDSFEGVQIRRREPQIR